MFNSKPFLHFLRLTPAYRQPQASFRPKLYVSAVFVYQLVQKMSCQGRPCALADLAYRCHLFCATLVDFSRKV